MAQNKTQILKTAVGAGCIVGVIAYWQAEPIMFPPQGQVADPVQEGSEPQVYSAVSVEVPGSAQGRLDTGREPEPPCLYGDLLGTSDRLAGSYKAWCEEHGQLVLYELYLEADSDEVVDSKRIVISDDFDSLLAHGMEQYCRHDGQSLGVAAHLYEKLEIYCVEQGRKLVLRMYEKDLATEEAVEIHTHEWTNSFVATVK